MSCGPAPTDTCPTRSLAPSLRMTLTVPSPLFATQTSPAPTATPFGASPTWIVRSSPLSFASRVTDEPRAFVTHTAVRLTAMSMTPRETGNVFTSRVRLSTRSTCCTGLRLRLPRLPIHTASSSAATANGFPGGSSCGSPITRPVRASRCVSVLDCSDTSQTVSPSEVMSVVPTGMRSDDGLRAIVLASIRTARRER